jgi:TRAP-type C4-dicarboxylate transport system substrate-binding protein
MSTAQAFYEIYKSLPKKTRKEVLELIQEDMVLVSKKAVEEAVMEVKKLKTGKASVMEMEDLLRQLKS